MLYNNQIGKFPVAYEWKHYRYVPIGFLLGFNQKLKHVFEHHSLFETTLPINFDFKNELSYLNQFLGEDVHGYFQNGNPTKSKKVVEVYDEMCTAGFGGALHYRIKLK